MTVLPEAADEVTVIYDPDHGEAVPDGHIEWTYRSVRNCPGAYYKFGTAVMIDRLRQGHVEGEIILTLSYDGNEYPLNAYANLPQEVLHSGCAYNVGLEILGKIIDGPRRSK